MPTLPPAVSPYVKGASSGPYIMLLDRMVAGMSDSEALMYCSPYSTEVCLTICLNVASSPPMSSVMPTLTAVTKSAYLAFAVLVRRPLIVRNDNGMKGM
jgi:hypothetical protein